MHGLAIAFGIGIVAGIALFFVFAYFGYIDKLLNWVDKKFS